MQWSGIVQFLIFYFKLLILVLQHALLCFEIPLDQQLVLPCFEAPCSNLFAIFPLRLPWKCICFVLLSDQTVYLTLSFLLRRALFFLHKDLILTFFPWRNNTFIFLFPSNWGCVNFFMNFFSSSSFFGPLLIFKYHIWFLLVVSYDWKKSFFDIMFQLGGFWRDYYSKIQSQ